MGDVVNIDDEEVNRTAIFYLDDRKFAKWVKRCNPSVVEALKKLLIRFFELWCERLSEQTLTNTFFVEFMRIMTLHKIPFKCTWQALSNVHEMYTLECCYKFQSVGNVTMFFNAVSDFESRCRWNMWTARKRYYSSLPYHLHTFLREQYMFAARDLNYRSMASCLGSSRFLRQRVSRRDILACTMVFDCALQTTVASARNSPNISSKLVTLAKNAVVSVTFYTGAKNPVVSLLTETLTTALAQDDRGAIEGILDLEKNLDRRAKTIEEMGVWNAYRLLDRFVIWNFQGRRPSPVVEVLVEELADQERSLRDERATVFVEAATVLYSSIGKLGPLSRLLLNFLRKCPGTIGRFYSLLIKLDLLDEAEAAVEAAANSELHASDPMWLVWCGNRLTNAARYGPLEEVYLSCLRRLFDFLDFGSNRLNENAWMMLWTIIQKVNVTNVIPLWADRSSWWPRFHSSVRLSPTAQKQRDQVIAALRNEATLLF